MSTNYEHVHNMVIDIYIYIYIYIYFNGVEK